MKKEGGGRGEREKWYVEVAEGTPLGADLEEIGELVLLDPNDRVLELRKRSQLDHQNHNEHKRDESVRRRMLRTLKSPMRPMTTWRSSCFSRTLSTFLMLMLNISRRFLSASDK